MPCIIISITHEKVIDNASFLQQNSLFFSIVGRPHAFRLAAMGGTFRCRLHFAIVGFGSRYGVFLLFERSVQTPDDAEDAVKAGFGKRHGFA